MKNLLFLSSIAGFLMLFVFLFTNFPGFPRKILTTLPSQKTANPAVQFCLNQGGTRVFKKGSSGESFAFCQFQDGSLCDEWAFYRKACKRSTPQR